MSTKPPKALLRPVSRALVDYGMIRNGDRVLIGVSGGKDSLTLLHLLRHLQRYTPVSFSLGTVTIDPMVDGFDPSPLQYYIPAMGIPHFHERQPIMERAHLHMDRDSFCSWCARIKRGIMYATARREGYNVIALAQHLDDLAESFLMSAFHNGRLNTMKAHYVIDAGDLRVIRPLVYVRERQTGDYARMAGLPVIGDNCPACFRMPTQREHMKQLLASEEVANKLLFRSLLSTLRPLMGSHRNRAGS
jgi:tRNA 2-thiocytidine biosynthesis protein TtcA